MKKPTIACVVLNWNRPQDTIDCVNSMLAGSLKPTVFVVDNGSEDDSLKLFSQQKWGKKVIVLRNETNEGYVGNNTGVKRALRDKAAYVFIINNDATVERNALEKLVHAAERLPQAAIVAPLIVYASKPDAVWSAGASFNNLIFKAGIRGDGSKTDDWREQEELQLTTGAAMLVRSTAVRQVGLLDEKYFAYYEETKWQHEMKKAGWKIALEPAAVVRHKVAASTGGGESPLSTYYLVRNRGLFIRDECPFSLKPIAYASLVAEVLARAGLNAIKLRAANVIMACRGLFDFVTGKTGEMT